MKEDTYDKEINLADLQKSVPFVLDEKQDRCIILKEFEGKSATEVRKLYPKNKITEITIDKKIRKCEEKTCLILEIDVKVGKLTLQFNEKHQCIYATLYVDYPFYES